MKKLALLLCTMMTFYIESSESQTNSTDTEKKISTLKREKKLSLSEGKEELKQEVIMYFEKVRKNDIPFVKSSDEIDNLDN